MRIYLLFLAVLISYDYWITLGANSCLSVFFNTQNISIFQVEMERILCVFSAVFIYTSNGSTIDCISSCFVVIIPEHNVGIRCKGKCTGVKVQVYSPISTMHVQSNLYQTQPKDTIMYHLLYHACNLVKIWVSSLESATFIGLNIYSKEKDWM